MSFITVAELGRRLRRVDVEKTAEDGILQTEKEFIEKQTEQLFEGFMADGSSIEPPYAASTVKRKKKKGQPYDRVTFKDTGAYYEKMGITLDNDIIRIGSEVPYEKHITDRSGTGIYGLTEENRKEYVWKSLFPKIKARIESITKLVLR